MIKYRFLESRREGLDFVSIVIFGSLFFCIVAFSAFFIAIEFYPFVALVAALCLLPIFSLFIVGDNQRALWAVGAAGTAYLVLSILWPRYVALWIPGLPSINLPRVANIVLVAVIFLSLLKSSVLRGAFAKSFSKHTTIWILIFTYVAFRFFSALVSDEVFASLYVLLNEFGVHVVCLLVGLVFGFRSKGWLTIGKGAFVIFLIVGAVAVIEKIVGHNLFSRFIDPSNEYVVWAMSDKARGGVYRAQGTFGFPITLAEFAVTAFPIAIFGAVSFFSSNISRILMAALIALTAVAVIYVSGSRSGYVGFLVICAFLCSGVVFRTMFLGRVRLGYAVLSIFTFSLVISSSYFAILYVYELSFGASADRMSNVMRTVMYERAFSDIFSSPIFGFGPGSAPSKVGVLTATGQLTVDSKIVSIMIDSGLVALFSYLSFLMFAIAKTWWSSMKEQSVRGLWLLSLSASLFGFTPFLFILSLNDNQFLMFTILGMVLAVPNFHEERQCTKYVLP